MKQRFSEEQIIRFIKEQEVGITVDALCRQHGFAPATFYQWKSKYGGLDVSEAKRLKSLEQENTQLKKLLANSMLDNAKFKEVLSKK